MFFSTSSYMFSSMWSQLKLFLYKSYMQGVTLQGFTPTTAASLVKEIKLEVSPASLHLRHPSSSSTGTGLVFRPTLFLPPLLPLSIRVQVRKGCLALSCCPRRNCHQNIFIVPIGSEINLLLILTSPVVAHLLGLIGRLPGHALLLPIVLVMLKCLIAPLP